MDIFHIDANSAYLSWTAAALLERGYPVDIREVPSVISGNPKERNGIILAKSIPAKKKGVRTGEPLHQAMNKCPGLLVFSPDYDLYLLCSDAMFRIMRDYSPLVQRYSVDECFLDYTASAAHLRSPLHAAAEIKERIKEELGFTVNVGISCNKLLAKMASEFEKPDKIHTLYPEEIEKKMWPLPVEDLFMVGSATAKKLRQVNITTIGQLAQMEESHLRALFKSHGTLVWQYANGRDDSKVLQNWEIEQKGVSGSVTTAYDMTEKEEVQPVLLALCERTAMRLRRLGRKASLVRVYVKTDSFVGYGHQMRIGEHVDSATDLFYYTCALFEECWRGEAVRKLGVSVSDFGENENLQVSMFGNCLMNIERNSKLEKTVDEIRSRYGEGAIIRGTFANTGLPPMLGGVNDGDYLMMGGYRL